MNLSFSERLREPEVMPKSPHVRARLNLAACTDLRDFNRAKHSSENRFSLRFAQPVPVIQSVQTFGIIAAASGLRAG